MAGSVNKVILIGNLGKDPEIRRLENGTVVANFPLATSEVYTDRTTGEKRESTDWHDIVVWRGLAEVVEKYVKKGYKLYIEGKIKKRSWTDKEGIVRYTTEIIADELSILSRPEGNQMDTGTQNKFTSEGTPTPPSRIDEIINGDEDSDLPF